VAPTTPSSRNWSRRFVKAIYVIAAIVAILAFFGIRGCSPPGPERAIIGTWKFEDPPGKIYDQKSVIFTGDKTVILTLFYGNEIGKYEFITSNRLSMDFGRGDVWVVDMKQLPDGRFQWDNYPPAGNGDTFTRFLVRQEQ
jgi:hypothetical protein